MNAHIEHDLPVAVVATCAARGLTPTTRGVREDYELVNDLLADVEGEIRRSFLTKVGKAADGHLGPVAHLVSAWNIDKARDLAWANTLALWELRRVERVAKRYAGALARTVGMGSRLLLTPLARDGPRRRCGARVGAQGASQACATPSRCGAPSLGRVRPKA